jgi:dsDNA-binding SOS-regulon protein
VDKPTAASTPEERLEALRFFLAERDDNLKRSLLDWMQETEEQIADLRKRLNELPLHTTREPIRW